MTIMVLLLLLLLFDVVIKTMMKGGTRHELCRRWFWRGEELEAQSKLCPETKVDFNLFSLRKNIFLDQSQINSLSRVKQNNSLVERNTARGNKQQQQQQSVCLFFRITKDRLKKTCKVVENRSNRYLLASD